MSVKKRAKLTRSIRNTRFVFSRTALRGEVTRGKITRAIAGMPFKERRKDLRKTSNHSDNNKARYVKL